MTQTRHSYTIMGATGHVGRVVAKRLLKTGAQVRGIGRNSERMRGTRRSGSHPLHGCVRRCGGTARGVQGRGRCLCHDPTGSPDPRLLGLPRSGRIGHCSALRNARVKFVVSLSSIGAHLGEKTGPIRGLHNQEVCLNDIKDLNVIHLRPAYFMENLL